jgi:hypothetical protein
MSSSEIQPLTYSLLFRNLRASRFTLHEPSFYWKKMIGKVLPMAGFDERELETGPRQVGLRRHLRKEWQWPPKA